MGISGMGLSDFAARIDRLSKLGRGLTKELALWRNAHTLLNSKERQVYTAGIDAAVAGIENARIALANATQRIEAERQARARGAPGI